MIDHHQAANAHTNVEPASAVFGTTMFALLAIAVLYALAAYFDWVPGPLG